METVKIAAILSTTVLPVDGTYVVETLRECPNIFGCPHYIGHLDTKQIVEGLGAVSAPTRLFGGLEVGEQAICFPITQGKGTRVRDGFTTPHQGVKVTDLTVRSITRIA